MSQWKLRILKPGEKEVISNPSWEQIQSVKVETGELTEDQEWE